MTAAAVPLFQVIDLFAGPGGLAEGFAAVTSADQGNPFQIALSIEKEKVAHSTLLFRAFLRKFEGGFPEAYYSFLNGEIAEPDWATDYPDQWNAASNEAVLVELGASGADSKLQPYLESIQANAAGRTVVIGGPPCQAYSVVGRARNKGKANYKPEKDKRHFLYRDYIKILEKLRPAAFVMENVKGMLSSSVGGQAIFKRILGDLDAIGGDARTYELYAFESGPNGFGVLKPTREPRDFLIKAEQFEVPQARHRIIIVGVRRDFVPDPGDHKPASSAPEGRVAVSEVLRNLPPLRSGISRRDTLDDWTAAMARSVAKVIEATSSKREKNLRKVHQRSRYWAKKIAKGEYPIARTDSSMGGVSEDCPQRLANWILDPKLTKLQGHSSRGHMESDLARYFFASVFAEVCRRSPVAREYPAALAPSHKNWHTGIFSDRFRVQLWATPSTTITSHISKDGHYFIHPDPIQCRALTVREAARLQTFPDNYRFLGNQTQQYEQVGNAVPPFLARQIGEALFALLGQNRNKPE